MRRGITSVLAALLVIALAVPAAAHPKDIVKSTRVGPIRFNKTKIGQVNKWFGKANFLTTINIFGCTLKISSWGSDPNSPRLAVVRRKGSKKVRSATAARKKLDAGVKGTLKPHTGKGLRIGNSVAKLKELYPDATSTDVDGGKQWALASGANGTVQARAKSGQFGSCADFFAGVVERGYRRRAQCDAACRD